MEAPGSTHLIAVLTALLSAACSPRAEVLAEEPEERVQEKASEPVWVDPSTLLVGETRHDSLPPEVEQRIRKVQRVFSEVDPTTPEKWIEDFKRDQNYESELRTWEAMAKSFADFVEGSERDQAEKEEAFALLLMRSGASTEEVLQRAKLKVLSREEVKMLLDSYSLEAKPVRIQEK